MTGDIAIRVEGLGKRYRIGQCEPYRTLRDSLRHALGTPWRVFQRPATHSQNPAGNHIWALRDVSFDVPQGGAIGIIGRNGAGKSTLLKILSRITKPTRGFAEIRGRVGSLLEVGTGFHPELTGRENIYLNGAILGMGRKEIGRKFDEIVAFAEVEKFIDTPVKHYSSGMYVRLAFAVAAHLEPETLLVDEVLAVGDVAFQRKCLGKMDGVAKGGRTVLLVSHQMNSIRKLCNTSLWLDAGVLRMIDSTAKTISAYESEVLLPSADGARMPEGNHVPARFQRWEILEPQSDQPNMLTTSGPVSFRMVVKVNRPIRDGVHGIALHDRDNRLIWAWATYRLKLEAGVHEFVYTLSNLPLRPGLYSWHVTLYDEGSLLDAWHCVPDLIIATEALTHPRDEWSGILNLPCEFHLEPLEKVAHE